MSEVAAEVAEVYLSEREMKAFFMSLLDAGFLNVNNALYPATCLLSVCSLPVVYDCRFILIEQDALCLIHFFFLSGVFRKSSGQMATYAQLTSYPASIYGASTTSAFSSPRTTMMLDVSTAP